MRIGYFCVVSAARSGYMKSVRACGLRDSLPWNKEWSVCTVIDNALANFPPKKKYSLLKTRFVQQVTAHILEIQGLFLKCPVDFIKYVSAEFCEW